MLGNSSQLALLRKQLKLPKIFGASTTKDYVVHTFLHEVFSGGLQIAISNGMVDELLLDKVQIIQARVSTPCRVCASFGSYIIMTQVVLNDLSQGLSPKASLCSFPFSAVRSIICLTCGLVSLCVCNQPECMADRCEDKGTDIRCYRLDWNRCLSFGA